jgi:hypothetical protein
MGAGRCATSINGGFLAPGPRERRRSRACRRAIWSEHRSRLGKSRGDMLGESWCARVDHLTSKRNKAACRASAIASACQFIARMATVTPPPSSCDQEEPFLPRITRREHPGLATETPSSSSERSKYQKKAGRPETACPFSITSISPVSGAR